MYDQLMNLAHEYLPHSLVGIFGFILYFLRMFREKIIAAILSASWSPKANLLNHHLFTTMEHINVYDIPMVKFSDDANGVKEAIFTDFIAMKMDKVQLHVVKLINEKKLFRMSSDELRLALHNTTNEMLKDCNANMYRKFKDKGLNDKEIDYAIFNFNKWNDANLSLLIEQIDIMCSSPFYRNNYSKVVYFLELFTIIVKFTAKDGVDAFNKMNGFYKNVNYAH